ncbi:MAG: trypsin-like peptidase domain-containing protein [Betaproteobacteria bacterium]|nr:trypsin-like peptidase domain-containing protein [Betaproteobacteria bacterium]
MQHGLRILLLVIVLPWGAAVLAQQPDWSARVFKLTVTRVDGATELGSAVPLGGEKLVTNCHVLRQAARIEVRLGDADRLALSDQRDAYRDMCFLTLPGLRAPPMPMIDIGATRVGMEVMAAGYSSGELAIGKGRIVGLHHCECDGGKIIQTSAAFDRGASGGGLFDTQGRLTGVLTFKAKSGGNFHFALPVGWLRHAAIPPVTPAGTGEDSFWERPGRESGYFLAACDLGAQRKWQALTHLAREWTQQEPNNPEAWMALGRALKGMGQNEAAVAPLQRALLLDSTHAEAKWAMDELEFELGRSLSEPDGL